MKSNGRLRGTVVVRRPSRSRRRGPGRRRAGRSLAGRDMGDVPRRRSQVGWHVFTRLHWTPTSIFARCTSTSSANCLTRCSYRLPSLAAGIAAVGLARWVRCGAEDRGSAHLRLARGLLLPDDPVFLRGARVCPRDLLRAHRLHRVARGGSAARGARFPRSGCRSSWASCPHLTFAHVYFALLAWSVARGRSCGGSPSRGASASAVRWHAVPCCSWRCSTR